MRTLEFSSEAQVRAQSIIYELVGLAARRDNIIEFWTTSVGLAQVHETEVGEWGVGLMNSPSQNCCSLSRLYNTSNSMLRLPDKQ